MRRITQAVILAGGAGTRLAPFTLKNPKPMVPINGKPFLEYLLAQLKENGILEVLILTGYLDEKIRKHFGSGEKFGIKIKYSNIPFLNDQGEENQSGLRIKNAQKQLKNFFLLLYCDNYWPLNLGNHIKYFNNHPCEILITVFSNLDNSTKSNTLVGNDGYIKKYDKSRQSKNLNGVEIGYMIVNKKIVKLLPKTNSKLEAIVFPKLMARKKLAGLLTDQKYYSIGDMARVKITEKFLTPKKIILLDRDGVINEKPDKGTYIKNWEEFKFCAGSIEAIKVLNKSGYKIFVISNQAGIARGKMQISDLMLIHKNMKKELRKNGAKIDGIYFCPHGWDAGCLCRKPKPGMLLNASNEHLFDLTKAVFIGDDIRDQQAGDAAGCKTVLLTKNQNLYQTVKLMLYSNSIK